MYLFSVHMEFFVQSAYLLRCTCSEGVETTTTAPTKNPPWQPYQQNRKKKKIHNRWIEWTIEQKTFKMTTLAIRWSRSFIVMFALLFIDEWLPLLLLLNSQFNVQKISRGCRRKKHTFYALYNTYKSKHIPFRWIVLAGARDFFLLFISCSFNAYSFGRFWWCCCWSDKLKLLIC